MSDKNAVLAIEGYQLIRQDDNEQREMWGNQRQRRVQIRDLPSDNTGAEMSHVCFNVSADFESICKSSMYHF